MRPIPSTADQAQCYVKEFSSHNIKFTGNQERLDSCQLEDGRKTCNLFCIFSAVLVLHLYLYLHAVKRFKLYDFSVLLSKEWNEPACVLYSPD